MSNVIAFPAVNGAAASSRTMPGLTTPELRERAVWNYYSEERRKHVPPSLDWDRAQAFGRDLERIAKILMES